MQNKNEVLLSANNIVKKFGAFAALKGVNFELRAGEIHALFGANGAGKSTLAKVVCGHHAPTDGALILNGNAVKFARPRDAMEAGVGIVTQETSLADDLPVWENIGLPAYGSAKNIKQQSLKNKAQKALEKLGFADDIPLNKLCGDLSSAHRQVVEIARIVALDSKVIILDEPTAALSPNESARLFKVMDQLRAEGHGLIFVSHRLEEIFAMTDRITVLRDGHSVSENLDTDTLTQAELVRHMVGRDVQALAPESIPDTSKNDVLLKLENVRSGREVRNVSLKIHQGEIVGLGGLVGAGRSELAEMLTGSRSLDGGAIELLGQPYVPSSPKAAIAAGLGFLPEDRRRQSIIPDFSVRENILLSHLSQQKTPLLQYDKRAKRINELAELIELATDRLDDSSLLNFSGGMQQKSLIIRALMLEPKVLILDEPTKGVDIGSRATIYALLRKLAEQGMAILLISSDFEELLALSHRVVPISDGQTIGSVSASEINEEQLTLICAPRSSLERQKLMLADFATQFDVQAAWVIQAGQQSLFLSREGQIEGASMPEPGAVVRKSDTAIAKSLLGQRGQTHTEESGAKSILFTVENKRGLGLGGIALLSSPSRASDFDSSVKQTISQYLANFDEGEMQLSASEDQPVAQAKG